MDTIKTTYKLFIISIAFIFVLMSMDYPADGAFTTALVKVVGLWIVALVSIPIAFITSKIKSSKAEYLGNYNFMVGGIHFLVFISWIVGGRA